MKRFLFLLTGCISLGANAQTYNMSNSTETTCSGTFYDSGGPSSNYSVNENLVKTFISNNGNRVQVSFSSFSTNYNNDFLYVYDGPSINHPLIGQYTGGGSFSVQSSGTSLTFRFASNGVGSMAGWTGTISCTTPPLTTYPLTNGQTVTACEGVFYDEAGPGVNYSHNQDNVMTFCPLTAADYLVFSFPYEFQLFYGDTLFVYSGNNTSTPPIGVYTYNHNGEKLTIASPTAGACLTFRFTSDGSYNERGWQGFLSCTTTQPPILMNMHSGTLSLCSGTFYDAGGPSADYGTNSVRQLTLTSGNGNRIQVNFSSMLIANDGDVLTIYDGPTANHPVLYTITGPTGSFNVQSSGTSLTFRLASNFGTTMAGWAGTISCTTPALPTYPLTNGQTVTACDGVFYDDGGPGVNYSDNQDKVMTFCPSTSADYLVFRFPYEFLLNIYDTLFVYSGSNTSTPPIGVYTYDHNGENLTIASYTPGSCLTFRFKSDGSMNYVGWQAFVSCTTTQPPILMNMHSGTLPLCSGTFYDSGGPSSNYDNYDTRKITLTSGNGNRIQVNFSSLSIASGDYLKVYDGPTTSHPLLATLVGTYSSLNLQSSGTSLTFSQYTDGVTTMAGWAGTVSCTTPVIPAYPLTNGQTVTACDGVFYDNGGGGGIYSDNLNSVMTFCPSTPADYLVFTFPYEFSLATYDTLFVYSGTNTSSLPIGVYTSGNVAGMEIVSHTAGACLTFRFKSDGSFGYPGWQGFISCSPTQPAIVMHMQGGNIPVCGGTFYDSGGPLGYYGDYYETRQVTLSSTSGCAIAANFTSFNVDNNGDYLRIYDGPNTSAPLIGAYTGNLGSFAVQSTGSTLTFRFTSNASIANWGWAANLSCPTTTNATVTPSGNVALCEGDSVTLNASNATTYLWNTGDTTSSIVVDTSGFYTVTITNNIGCTATSSVVSVNLNPLPPVPVITQNGGLLTSTTGVTYQWYLNGNPIPGATGQNYMPLQNGQYSVMITDANGCTNISTNYYFNSVGILASNATLDFTIMPNPGSGLFTISSGLPQQSEVRIFNLLGETIYHSTLASREISLTGQPRGVYFVEVRVDGNAMTKKLVIQ